MRNSIPDPPNMSLSSTKKLASSGTLLQSWTFGDQHILRSSMLPNKKSLLPFIRHLHIIDLDQSSPTDLLKWVPSLRTLTVNVPMCCVYSEGNLTNDAIYHNANRSIFEYRNNEYNTGVEEIFRSERTFDLSGLVQDFYLQKQDVALECKFSATPPNSVDHGADSRLSDLSHQSRHAKRYDLRV